MAGLLILILVPMMACATVHNIQPIVYKPPGFDETRYQADLAECRQMVESQAPVASGGTIAGQTGVGAVIGGAVGALIGLPFGRPLSGATIGASVGGGTAAAGAYAGTEMDRRRAYHSAISQCLALKGYRVMDATIAQ